MHVCSECQVFLCDLLLKSGAAVHINGVHKVLSNQLVIIIYYSYDSRQEM